MTATVPTTDRHGFAVRACKRCHGSGRHQYNSDLHTSTCFTCGGRSFVHTVAGRRQYQAWQEAIKAAQAIAVRDLVAGDHVAYQWFGTGSNTRYLRCVVDSVEYEVRGPDEEPFCRSTVGQVVTEYRESWRVTLRADSVMVVVFHDGDKTLTDYTRPYPPATEFVGVKGAAKK